MRPLRRGPNPVTQFSETRLESVRTNDPDRYLAALMAPLPLRDYLISLYAFANEIARVRDVTTDPMVAAVRLQWWRDLVTTAAASDPQDPVGEGVAALLKGNLLAPTDLMTMIDARERDLEDHVISTWDELDHYCDGTAGLVIRAALKLGGAPNDELATMAGRCWGITGLVRAFPFHAGQGRVYMPAEAFDDVGLDPHAVFQGQESQKAFAILFAASARAVDYWQDMKPLMARLPKAARAAVSYVGFYDLYARQLRSRPGEAYLIHPEIPAFRKQFKFIMGGLG